MGLNGSSKGCAGDGYRSAEEGGGMNVLLFGGGGLCKGLYLCPTLVPHSLSLLSV